MRVRKCKRALGGGYPKTSKLSLSQTYVSSSVMVPVIRLHPNQTHQLHHTTNNNTRTHTLEPGTASSSRIYTSAKHQFFPIRPRTRKVLRRMSTVSGPVYSNSSHVGGLFPKSPEVWSQGVWSTIESIVPAMDDRRRRESQGVPDVVDQLIRRMN